MQVSARGRWGRVGWMDDLWGPFQPQISMGLRHLGKDGSVRKGKGKQRRVEEGGERYSPCWPRWVMIYFWGERRKLLMLSSMMFHRPTNWNSIQSLFLPPSPACGSSEQEKQAFEKERAFCPLHSKQLTWSLTYFGSSMETMLKSVLETRWATRSWFNGW